MGDGVNIFDLAAKISLDSKGVDSSLTATQKKVLELAKEFEKTEKAATAATKKIETGAKQAGQAISKDMQGALQQVSPGLAGLAGAGGPITLIAAGLAAITGAAVAAGYGIFSLAESTAEYAGKLHDTSKQVNYEVETLSALQIAAKTSGGSFESVSNALMIFEKNMVSAQNTSSAMGKTFKELNIVTKDQEQALRQAFTALGKMGETEKQADDAKKLFGKSAKDVLGIIKETNGNLDEAIRKYSEMNILIGTDAAAAADAFSDELDLLNLQMASLGRTIGMQVMPVMTSFMENMSTALTGQKDEWRSWSNAIEIWTASALGSVQAFMQYLQSHGTVSIGVLFESNVQGLMDQANKQRGTIAAQSAVDRISRVMGMSRHDRDTSAGGGKQAKDVLAPYKAILDQVNRSLDFFGEKTEHAKIEQEFLSKGIMKLHGQLREQAEEYRLVALAIADVIDVKKKISDEEKKQAEAAKALERVTGEVDQAFFKQTQTLSDLQNRTPAWIRQTYDFITAKTMEGYAWGEAGRSMQDYFNLQAEIQAASVRAEGGTRPRSIGAATRPRQANPDTRPRRVFQAQYDEMQQRLHQLAGDITNVLSNSIRVGFEQGAAAGFKSLLQGFADMFARMAEMMLEKAIFKMLNQLVSAAAGGGGGTGFQGLPLSPDGFAAGGDFAAGRAMIVGERGPELMVPRSAGTVIPNHALGGGATHIHNWYITTQDAQSFMSGPTQHQIMRKLTNSMSRTELTG